MPLIVQYYSRVKRYDGNKGLKFMALPVVIMFYITAFFVLVTWYGTRRNQVPSTLNQVPSTSLLSHPSTGNEI